MNDDREQFRERVRAANNIVEVIGEVGRVKLWRSGKEMKGLCPFREERTASFFVNREKGAYRCYGCKAKGDVFTFIERMQGVDFPGALEYLANRAGIAMSGRNGSSGAHTTAPLPRAVPHEERTFPPSTEIAALWHLCGPVDRDLFVAAWFRSRKLDPALAAKLDLARELPTAGALPKWAACEGLDWGQSRHRCVVPLFDHHGRFVSLTPRCVGSAAKQKTLFPTGFKVGGTVMANAAARRMLETGQRVGELWVVEGIVDFLHAASVLGDVAVLGIHGGSWSKAFAERVPNGLNVVIATDPDETGQRYATEIVETLQGRVAVERWSNEGGLDLNAAGGPFKGKRGPILAAAPAVGAAAPRTGWAAAQDVHEFVNTSEPEADFLVPRLIVRGGITGWNSPRGTGKTLAAHFLAIDVARQGYRVLLIDRDNPRRDVKRRLRAWGLDGLEPGRLKVIAREDAPPLTDEAKWRAFPVGEYDLVVVDSFGSATEGVGEQDSARPSRAIGALLDVVRATKGPAALVLDNTTKSGSHGRGSGVIEDRLDIVFEVRDATGFTPTGTKDWWSELPSADRGSWADRASRRKHRVTYRLAFVPSKFRVGEEPDPFAFEVSCAQEPWTCTDVTAGLVQAGEDSRRAAEQAKTVHRDAGASALLAELQATQKRGEPLTLNDHAIPLLKSHGIGRDAARRLIEERDGTDWRVTGAGTKGAPKVLEPLSSNGAPAGNGSSESMRQSRSERESIPAGLEPVGPQESVSLEPLVDNPSKTIDCLRTTPANLGGEDATTKSRTCPSCGGEVLFWGSISVCRACHWRGGQPPPAVETMDPDASAIANYPAGGPGKTREQAAALGKLLEEHWELFPGGVAVPSDTEDEEIRAASAIEASAAAQLKRELELSGMATRARGSVP